MMAKKIPTPEQDVLHALDKFTQRREQMSVQHGRDSLHFDDCSSTHTLTGFPIQDGQWRVEGDLRVHVASGSRHRAYRETLTKSHRSPVPLADYDSASLRFGIRRCGGLRSGLVEFALGFLWEVRGKQGNFAHVRRNLADQFFVERFTRNHHEPVRTEVEHRYYAQVQFAVVPNNVKKLAFCGLGEGKP